MNDLKEYYKNYFKLFRDNAPKHMVEWGGYQKGEPTGMASSYESCVSFSEYISDKNASILDAGAGVSSWMLRKMFPNTTSTDPDLEYLNVVKSIVGGINYIHLIENCTTYDYVFWDYGNWQRIPMMQQGFNKCKYAMYIDDCHDNEVLQYATTLAKNNNCKIVNVNTLDEYGRWGLIIEKESK